MTAHDKARPDRIVAFVAEYHDDHGYPPTIREIAAAVGLASPSAALYHLRALAARGIISMEPGRYRTAVVVE